MALSSSKGQKHCCRAMWRLTEELCVLCELEGMGVLHSLQHLIFMTNYKVLKIKK
jgi:hypothetical protein